MHVFLVFTAAIEAHCNKKDQTTVIWKEKVYCTSSPQIQL